MQAAQVLAGYSARRGRPAAPRDGQEDPVARWTPSARASSRAARAQRHLRGQGQRAVRLDRQVRRLRLQQEPRRRLRAGRLPDRLAEGAPPRRILRRVDELRHGADRQAGACSSRTCAAAEVECLPPDINASQRRFLGRGRRSGVATPSARSRASARRRWRRWSRSARPTARSQASRISPARIDPRLLNRRQLESLAGGGRVRLRSSPTAPPSSPRPRPSSPMPRAPPSSARAGRAACSAAARPKRRADPPAARCEPGRWPSGWPPSATPSASISRPIRSMRSGICSPRTRCETFAELADDAGIADGEPRRRDHGRRWSRRRAGGPRPRAAAT